MTKLRVTDGWLTAVTQGRTHRLYRTPTDGSCHRPGTRAVDPDDGEAQRLEIERKGV